MFRYLVKLYLGFISFFRIDTYSNSKYERYATEYMKLSWSYLKFCPHIFLALQTILYSQLSFTLHCSGKNIFIQKRNHRIFFIAYKKNYDLMFDNFTQNSIINPYSCQSQNFLGRDFVQIMRLILSKLCKHRIIRGWEKNSVK